MKNTCEEMIIRERIKHALYTKPEKCTTYEENVQADNPIWLLPLLKLLHSSFWPTDTNLPLSKRVLVISNLERYKIWRPFIQFVSRYITILRRFFNALLMRIIFSCVFFKLLLCRKVWVLLIFLKTLLPRFQIYIIFDLD